MTDNASSITTIDAPVTSKANPKRDIKPRRQPPYNVILLDDDDHSYEYVILMLNRLFGHTLETAFRMAREVDETGRVIVDTTTRARGLGWTSSPPPRWSGRNLNAIRFTPLAATDSSSGARGACRLSLNRARPDRGYL